MKLPLRRPRVSVIGTRKPTGKGITDAREITQILVGRDALVVSGLAAGIDAVAHRTAIDLKGRTAAVLGTPLNRSYPRQNAGLQDRGDGGAGAGNNGRIGPASAAVPYPGQTRARAQGLWHHTASRSYRAVIRTDIMARR